METTSTPLRKKNNTKTAISKQLPDLTPVVNHAQEDEAERRNRRSLATIQKRLSALPSQGSPGLNSSSMGASIDIEEVKEHFKLCQKLFAENKINNKNAWNLKLIDYLNVLISQDIFGKDLMLVAATSLDICTKVYACRVDDLYAKGLQLASTITSLGRQEVVENDRIDEEDDDAGGKDEGGKRQPKKKKRRLSASQKHTIAKDPKSLEVPSIAKMQSVFFMGHIDIEASSNENLFTNKLPMDHIGYKIMLLNKTNQGMPYYGEEDPSVEQDQITTMKINPGPFKICRAFTGFHIDEWDPDQEEAQIAEIDNTQIPPAANDELVYDEQGIPVAELDGSIHDIFADEAANDDILEDVQEEVNNAGVANQEVEFISSFCPTTGNATFINNDLDPWWMKRVWVGPSHWKYKFIKPRATRFSGKINNDIPLARPKRKVHQLISVGIDFSDYQPMDISKKFKVSRKVKCDVEKVTLPLNYLPLAPDYRMLLLKPFVCRKDLPEKMREEEYEHSPYDYNNPNDSQYCSQHSILDEADENNEPPPDNDVIHEEEHEGNGGANMTTDMLANLVEAPEMVQQTYIPYALRAKKMNMKRLKNTMWEVLTEDKNNANIINIKEKPAKEMNLLHLYNVLPSRLPKSMGKELSPHLAFVSLLHLTNEHNLKLTGQADLKDIKIEQDKQK